MNKGPERAFFSWGVVGVLAATLLSHAGATPANCTVDVFAWVAHVDDNPEYFYSMPFDKITTIGKWCLIRSALFDHHQCPFTQPTQPK